VFSFLFTLFLSSPRSVVGHTPRRVLLRRGFFVFVFLSFFFLAMRYRTLQIAWHGEREPVLSVDFSAAGGGGGTPDDSFLLASGGADSRVRLWRLFPRQVTDTVDFEASSDAAASEESEKSKTTMGVQFVRTLDRHDGAVNCVRFSPIAPQEPGSARPAGQLDPIMLASGGDDRVIILWQREVDLAAVHAAREQRESAAQHAVGAFAEAAAEDAEGSVDEVWNVVGILRGHHSDVYDIAWAHHGRTLVSGSTDNSAIVWDVPSQRQICQITDHVHYVQGVAWAPQNLLSVWRSAHGEPGDVPSGKKPPAHSLLTTLSSDQSMRVYDVRTDLRGRKDRRARCLHTVRKRALPGRTQAPDSSAAPGAAEQGKGTTMVTPGGASKKVASRQRNYRMFVDEGLQSFFRRCGEGGGAVFLC
jgi:WD40 repeat protein